MGNQQVLVIEDDAGMRLNLAEMLRSEGWQVQEASGGKAGLAQIERDRPDLILCDIVMPDCDGYEVLSQVQAHPDTAQIPFIFLTGKIDAQDFRQGMCRGADDYLLKPVRRDELIQTVTAQIAKFKRRIATSESIAPLLQAQLQHLQLREQESQAWINGITHDLRAPLTTIRVALELIEKFPAKQDHYLTIARQACEQSDTLIEEMLTLYREEDSLQPAIAETCHLDRLLQTLHPTFEARARLQELNLIWDTPPAGLHIRAPRLTLQRILTELFNNAFKYTDPAGSIELGWKRLNEASVTIVIRNQAEIPAESLPYLFDKFYRVTDDSLENRLPSPWQNSSSGLGLNIVKQLVTQLNGNLTVVSQQGWTFFSLDLPVGPP